MTRILRFSWRAALLIAWVVVGLGVLALLFPLVNIASRQAIIRWWSAYLLLFCGLELRYRGEVIVDRPVLFVANHVSWLDIFIINKQRSTSFVAKKEIRSWPVVGWLVAGAGTVFIDREQRHALKGVIAQLEQKQAQNQAIGVFPEARTSDGLQVQPFHSSLFATALRTEMDVQPVALRYFQGEQRCPEIAFVGEQSLIHNAWQLLSRPNICVECEFLPVLAHEQNQARGRVLTAKSAQIAIEDVVLQGL